MSLDYKMINFLNTKKYVLKEKTLKSAKVFKFFFLCSLLFIFFVFIIFPQSIKKEKISYLINELSPPYSLHQRLGENLEIIGYDVLDENRNHIKSAKFIFLPEAKFYVIFYVKKNVMKGITLKKNRPNYLVGLYHLEEGGYFRSVETTYFIGKQKTDAPPTEWQIGGIYKIQFAFKVPKFALPKKYILEIRKEKSVNAVETTTIIDAPTINIKREKIKRSLNNGDYCLAPEGCLLDPAVKQNKEIIFPWTGNIKFFINKDLRNFKKIVIVAKGSPALGVYPLLKIYVNKKEIGNVYVNGEWNEYEFDLKLDKKGHILKIRYDNDGGGPGEDRNMYLNMIKLVR